MYMQQFRWFEAALEPTSAAEEKSRFRFRGSLRPIPRLGVGVSQCRTPSPVGRGTGCDEAPATQPVGGVP